MAYYNTIFQTVFHRDTPKYPKFKSTVHSTYIKIRLMLSTQEHLVTMVKMLQKLHWGSIGESMGQGVTCMGAFIPNPLLLKFNKSVTACDVRQIIGASRHTYFLHSLQPD